MNRVIPSVFLGLALLGIPGHAAAPAASAPSNRPERGVVNHAKLVHYMERMSAADAEKMRWTGNARGMQPPERKGNKVVRQGYVNVRIPGIEGRPLRAIQVDLSERVGAGDGPVVKLSLEDKKNGQKLAIALEDEAGTMKIEVGARSITIRQNPDGTLRVG
jgi:hypothetical protein